MVSSVAIDNIIIGHGHPCFIIAEAGVNHNGDINIAKRLIDAAKEANADAIKFQTFRSDRVVSAAAPKAKYQLETTDGSESQLDMLRHLELSGEMHQELQSYCQQLGVLFLSTPFDKESSDLLDELGVPAFKIGSGEITNWDFLDYVAQKRKPIILSTGMSHLSEVKEAVRIIRAAGNEQLILLHCVSNYPADPADANLRSMETMATAFQVPVGYSDHTIGIEVTLAAVALGACIIEKHFTLDSKLEGPDHRASLETKELQLLIEGIRTVEKAFGNGIKSPTSSEDENLSIVRRSLATSCEIPVGTIITTQMLRALRPASGISPIYIEQVIGRKAIRSFKTGQLISWSDLA